MIPVYPPPNVMFFKFLFTYKTFFACFCFLKIYITWQNFAREKWRDEVAKFYVVLFLFYVETYFLCAEVARRPIIILMKSMISFFIYSFYVLTPVYEAYALFKVWFHFWKQLTNRKPKTIIQ